MTTEPAAGLFETAADQEAIAAAVAAAAPINTEIRGDQAQVGALTPAVRPSMYTLLAQLADTKYVLGRRYAEWCTGAPQLEAAVAAAAMAQDELGHARSFYPVLRGFPEDAEQGRAGMEERGWQHRPTPTLQVLSRRFGSWAELIAANLVVDGALTILFDAAVDNPYEPLRQRARKIVSEECNHATHARGWVYRLADRPLQRAKLEAAVRRMGAEALAWYGPADEPVLSALEAAGLLSARPDDYRARLRQTVDPVLDQVGLAPLPTEVSFSDWDPSARRFNTASSPATTLVREH